VLISCDSLGDSSTSEFRDPPARLAAVPPDAQVFAVVRWLKLLLPLRGRMCALRGDVMGGFDSREGCLLMKGSAPGTVSSVKPSLAFGARAKGGEYGPSLSRLERALYAAKRGLSVAPKGLGGTSLERRAEGGSLYTMTLGGFVDELDEKFLL
jgi:hypothetical protein